MVRVCEFSVSQDGLLSVVSVTVFSTRIVTACERMSLLLKPSHLNNCRWALPWQVLKITTGIAREPRFYAEVQAGGCVEMVQVIAQKHIKEQTVDDPWRRSRETPS